MEYRQGVVLAAPAVALYGLFVVWPVLQVAWIALHRWNGYGPQTWTGLNNFALLWQDGSFRTALEHSVIWDVVALAAPAAIGFGLAMLARAARGRRAALAVLFFPALLPATALAALASLLFSPLSGPFNGLLGSIGLAGLQQNWLGDPHVALPALFGVWLWSSQGISTLLFSLGIASVGSEYMELAAIEGATGWWRARHVLLPALRRTTTVVLLINAALAGQVFDLIWVTTGGGPGNATMTLPLDMYGRAFDGRTGEGAAVAVVQLAVGIVLVVVAIVLGRPAGESFVTGEAREEGLASRGRGALATAGLLVCVAAVAAPLLWLITAAVEPTATFALGGGPTLDPRQWTGANIETVWQGGMAGAVARSLGLAALAVTLTIVPAVPAAFALTHLLGRRARITIGAVLVAGLLQPTPVLIIPLFSLLRELRLLDSAWGIVLPEAARTLPASVLVLWAWFANQPADVMEAARIDGAGTRAALLRIALPPARPALLAVAVWAFVGSWNEYLLPTVVSQNGSLSTVPTVLASSIGTYNTQFGLLAAGTALAIAPALVLFALLRRPAATGLVPAEHTIR